MAIPSLSVVRARSWWTIGAVSHPKRQIQAPSGGPIDKVGALRPKGRSLGSGGTGIDVLGVDWAIAAISAGQHGLITRRQLLDAGLTHDAIKHRVAMGRLHRIYRGAYAVGHPSLTPLGDLRAATLAYGERALITHRAATVLWEFTEQREGDDIDVTVVGVQRRERQGTKLHYVGSLAKADTLRRHGIPVTGPARTLVDFAEQATTAQLERALNEARVRQRVSDRSLEGAIERAGWHRGASRLARLLEQERGPGITRKEMERRFLQLIRRARLPLPETNANVLGKERDFFWPEHNLVVETDGWETHSTRAAFESDRHRDAELTANGYRVLRFTWRQITKEPEATLVVLTLTLRTDLHLLR